MEIIENKGFNPFRKLKVKIVDLLREMCFRFRNFLNRHTKDMCFSKRELEEIKKRVERTKESEVKFDKFTKVVPDIYALVGRLKDDITKLEKEKEFCLVGIRDIYIADVKGDIKLKEELFAKFGLPFSIEQ